MTEISDALLDALMVMPAVESLWLRPCNRRGSHFSRASADLLIAAPGATEQQWQQIIACVAAHEKWHLITAVRCHEPPEQGATQVRPR